MIKEIEHLNKEGYVSIYDKQVAFNIMNRIDGDNKEVFTIVENGVFHFVKNLEGTYKLRLRLLSNMETIKESFAIDFAISQVCSLIDYFCKGSF